MSADAAATLLGGRLARAGQRAAGRVADIAARAVRTTPDFLVIGTQKAGTTSLHAYLAAHPDLAPAMGPKELHYFNIYYHRGLRWYLSHFPKRSDRNGKLWFEATPDYLWHEQVPARVRKRLGSPKLIAVLRDPAERAYSAWNMWHSFATRSDRDSERADLRSFPEAIEAELASPTHEAHLHFHYVRMGMYADHIERWLAHFARTDLLLLDYSLMARDLPQFLDEIRRFLGIEPWKDETVRSLAQTRHWVGPKRSRTAADEETIARLRAYYKPFDARLEKLLGRPPGWRT